MRILLLDNSHLPRIGGKEIVVHHLANQYLALGHEVVLGGPSRIWADRKVRFSYPVKRLPSVSGLDKDMQWRMKVRWLLRGGYDIVHAHTTHPSGYAAARVLEDVAERGQSAPPLVVTPHGADIHKVPEVNFGKRLNPVLDEKIRWTLQRCGAATAISDSVRDSLLDAGIDAEKIVPIANGVDAQRLGTPVDHDARATLGLDADAELIVSIGNFHPRKGHATLVAATANSSREKLHLVIIGRTDPDFVADVERRGLSSRVTFTGAIPFPVPGQNNGPDLTAALLQQCNAYVSASMGEGTEGLSLALLEAMSAGTCIVATAVSGNRDIIEDGSNGLLVAPNSVEALTTAIDRVCANRVERDALAAASTKTVEPYSWRAIAGQYIELFERLLDPRTTTGADSNQPRAAGARP
ncbi:MAG: glycosyltransferase family 4 protein [Pseudomonadota bacterium]